MLKQMLTIVGTLFLLAVVLMAAVPQKMNYQATLADAGGVPVTIPTEMIFTIWDADIGGTALWAETLMVTPAALGQVNLSLGEVHPITEPVLDGSARYLGIKIGTDPEIDPRMDLLTSANSFHSAVADKALTVADDAVTSIKILDGTISFSDVGQNGAASGQVMKWNGSAWTAADDETGGGGSTGWVDNGTVVRLDVSTDSVGIGTTAPTEVLDVEGNIHASGTLSSGWPGGFTINGWTSTIFSPVDTLYLNNGHYVGRGITIEEFRLTTGASDGYVLTSNGSGFGTWLPGGGGGGTGWNWSDSSSHGPDSVLFADNATNADNAVNATNAANAVNATSALFADSTDAITDGAVDMADIAQAGASSGQVVKWNGSAWAPAADDAGSVAGWTDNGTVVRLDGVDDSVGIGTANPTEKLDVDGNIHARGMLSVGWVGNGLIIDGFTSTINTPIDTLYIDNGQLVSKGVHTDEFRLTTSSTNGYVLTSDGAGFGTWQAGGGGGGVTAGELSDTANTVRSQYDAADNVVRTEIRDTVGTMGFATQSDIGDTANTVRSQYDAADNAVRTEIRDTVGTMGYAAQSDIGDTANTVRSQYAAADNVVRTEIRDTVGTMGLASQSDIGDTANTVRSQYDTADNVVRTEIRDTAMALGFATGVIDDGTIVRLDGIGDSLGIGTIAPTEKLDVAGNIHASGTIISGNSITIDGVNDKITASTGTIDFDDENLVTTGKATIGNNNTNTGVHSFNAGADNTVTNAYGIVLGQGNTVIGGRATVSGGTGNSASAGYSTVGGGIGNDASSNSSTVGGGGSNVASQPYTSIGGGYNNAASGSAATVGGGNSNMVAGDYSAISGGYADTITATADYSYLFGIGSKLTEDSTFMVDMPHIRFGDEATGYEVPSSDGTIGQVLETDGSGQLSWTTPSAGAVSGWTDGGTVVRLDAVNDSVGIGTTTPTEKLEVAGNIRVTGKANIGSSNTNAGDYAFVAGRFNDASGIYSTVGGGAYDTASGVYSSIGGGILNLATADYSTVGGGRYNKARGQYSVVAGGGGLSASDSNSAGANYATVSGGHRNSASSNYSAVGGGSRNIASGLYSTVGGGTYDSASGTYSVVGGGYGNAASGSSSFIGGGYLNAASANYTTVSGGRYNKARGLYSVVAGGGGGTAADSNSAGADYSTVSGGRQNSASGLYSAVGGGSLNKAAQSWATIAGGYNNDATSAHATVGGGTNNDATGTGTTISGGYYNDAGGSYSTIGGGQNNITSGTNTCTISGGFFNIASGSYSTVGGGSFNKARGQYSVVAGGGGQNASDSNLAMADYATVSGGRQNLTSSNYSAVGGGRLNVASDTGATVGGGTFNKARGKYSVVAGGGGTRAADSNSAGADYSTVSGGRQNSASGSSSTVGGGRANSASGDGATVAGGAYDTASGNYSMVLGGTFNTASGDYSFAAGRQAKATHYGAFVWAGGGSANFSSSANDQFNVRAAGGTRIYSNSGLTAGVTLAAGGSSWSAVSDSTLKENIRPVNGQEILDKLAQMPISRWNYKAQDAGIEHVGPMAQDFYRLFGLGEDDKHINTLDPDGIALAAIKGLYEKTKQLENKTAEIDQLKEQLSDLTVLVQTLLAERDRESTGADKLAAIK